MARETRETFQTEISDIRQISETDILYIAVCQIFVISGFEYHTRYIQNARQISVYLTGV